MACWLSAPSHKTRLMRDKLILFVGIPVLGLISKQDTIFCHRTQEWAILTSVLEFRWLKESPFLLQVLQLAWRLSRAGWRQSLWIATSDCPGPDQRSLSDSSQDQVLTERTFYQALQTNISCFSFLQKTPSAVVTMYRGTALWTTVNLESSICYWQKTLRCSRCRLLLGWLLSYRYDPAMVALTVTSWVWNAANITFHLALISQMIIILSSTFLPHLITMDLIFELLLWRYSLSILPGLSNGPLGSQDRGLSDGEKLYTPKQT